MDFFELLLLLAFVGFPLLQFILEKLGGGRQTPPPDEPVEPLPPAAPVPPQEKVLPTESQEDWSSGWGSWPTETLEGLASREVVTEEQAEELAALQEHFDSHAVPEATRVSVPVVSLEPLHVDRKSEHARLHARPTSRAPQALRRSGPDIGSSLRTPNDLRRAIILAEVLGKPRGLQEY